MDCRRERARSEVSQNTSSQALKETVRKKRRKDILLDTKSAQRRCNVYTG